MVKFFGDAAGGTDHGFTVVAGWIATFEQWERFETDWRLLLASHKLPYFHMKECAHFKGPFAGMSEGERAALLKNAAAIIRGRVLYGFACLVEHGPFERLAAQYRLVDAVGCPYALAGRDCVAHASRLRKAQGHNEPIEYVFESGDEGDHHLVRIMRRDGKSIPIFKPSVDTDDASGMVQLQAADFAAYELRKAFRDNPQESPMFQHRKSIEALASIPAWWGKYGEADLQELIREAGIPPTGQSASGDGQIVAAG